jgi:DNA repair protein RadC
MPRSPEHRYQLSLEYPAPSFLDSREPSLHRFIREAAPPAPIVNSPAVAAHYLMERIYTPFASFTNEELWLLLLNTRNRITHEALLYRGTINEIRIRPAEVFRAAIRYNAAGLILSHCHPSGDATPSPQDVAMTEALVQAGKLLDCPIFDHLIVGDNRYTSLREKGMGFA